MECLVLITGCDPFKSGKCVTKGLKRYAWMDPHPGVAPRGQVHGDARRHGAGKTAFVMIASSSPEVRVKASYAIINEAQGMAGVLWLRAVTRFEGMHLLEGVAMEVRWLEEYLELADSLNFTEAASKLHVAQPTLSKHLAALEQELGAQLIDRSHNKISLTEEGVYFTGVCETIISQLDQAKLNLALMKNRRPLRISGRLEDSVVSGLFSAVSSAMIDRGYSPLAINQGMEASNFAKLDNGATDILLDILPPKEKRSGRYAFKKLIERPFVAVVDAGNPLAVRESLSVQDLKDQTLVKLSWHAVSVGWQAIADLCEESGFAPNARCVAVRSLPEALAIPLNDDILLYPVGSELSFLNPMKRKIIPIRDGRAHFDINLIYLKESEGDLQEFLEVFDETLEAFRQRDILLSEVSGRLG